MANTIAYQTLLAEELDKVLTASLKTGAMEANAGGIRYNGGNKFQFGKMTLGDVADYSRTNGYTDTAVTLEYEEKTFDKDWGNKFLLDAMDVDESNFLASATNVLGEFERTKAAPAVDTYRMGKLASFVPAANTISTAPTAANIYSQILTGLDAVTGETGLDASEFDIYIAHSVNAYLKKSSEISKVLNIGANAQAINNVLTSINGAALIEMPDSRMVTLDDSLAIRFIIAHKKAPIAIVKHDAVRIFDPSVVQDADGWRITYRLYHTLEVKDNEQAALYANVATA